MKWLVCHRPGIFENKFPPILRTRKFDSLSRSKLNLETKKNEGGKKGGREGGEKRRGVGERRDGRKNR